MIDLFPFSGFTVAVLGLGAEGLATARALMLSGAEVWAWDDLQSARAAGAAAELRIVDLADCDWSLPVSLVIEHAVPHDENAPHPVVAKARAAGLEVIADTELLARAQRDAGYVAVASRRQATPAIDLIGRLLQLSGREAEVGGDAARPPLALHPLDLGGTYVLAMPPGRADLTLSITFDVAVLLDLGAGAWPPSASVEESYGAARWVFHRQSGAQGAVVNVDDAMGRRALAELEQRADQVVVPVSARAAVPGGVYVAGNVLFDDMGGRAEPVLDLARLGVETSGEDRLQLAQAYAVARLLGVEAHAAMASIASNFVE